jgi:maltose phosphorylase
MFCNVFFEDHFFREELQNNFEFYESFTVHESSFAMRSFDTSSIRQNGYGIHLLFRTSRLDLDDYNKEVEVVT